MLCNRGGTSGGRVQTLVGVGPQRLCQPIDPAFLLESIRIFALRMQRITSYGGVFDACLASYNVPRGLADLVDSEQIRRLDSVRAIVVVVGGLYYCLLAAAWAATHCVSVGRCTLSA